MTVIEILKTILENKELVISSAKIFAVQVKNDEKVSHSDRMLNLGKFELELMVGLCSNLNALNFSTIPIFESMQVHESYPVAGKDEYYNGLRKGTLWLNPERWTFIEKMLKHLENKDEKATCR